MPIESVEESAHGALGDAEHERHLGLREAVDTREQGGLELLGAGAVAERSDGRASRRQVMRRDGTRQLRYRGEGAERAGPSQTVEAQAGRCEIEPGEHLAWRERVQ